MTNLRNRIVSAVLSVAGTIALVSFVNPSFASDANAIARTGAGVARAAG